MLLSITTLYMKLSRINLDIRMNMKKTHIWRLDKVNKYLQVKYTPTKIGHLIRQVNPKRVTRIKAQRLQLIKMFEDLFDRKATYRKQFGKWKMIIEEVAT